MRGRNTAWALFKHTNTLTPNKGTTAASTKVQLKGRAYIVHSLILFRLLCKMAVNYLQGNE
jgi:hypothetical protein